MNIIISGHSSTQRPNQVKETLSEDEYTYWLSIAGGNELYIGGYLRNPKELDHYVGHVQEIAEIESPRVGIIGYDSGQKLSADYDAGLDSTDYRIITALQDDSRKALSDVAEELNLSAKTVRRRLEILEAQDVTHYSIKWYPEASNDIISIFNLHLPPGFDRNNVGTELIQEHHPHALFFWSFSNIPNYLMMLTWNATMSSMMDLQMALRESNAIDNLVANIVYSGHVFETWRDRFVETQLQQKQ
jgi:hypothetical protein